MKPKWWDKGKRYLVKRDKVMRKILMAYKGHLTTRKNFFYSLSRSIISQQISVSAADAVFSRFEKKCKGKIKPKIVSRLSISDLRKCGLSRMKAKGIKSLAKRILDKSFDPKLIKKMSDEDAINYLSSLRQIGRWSSEMVLIFFYNRPNIWPVQDIGLLRAISQNYKSVYPPSKKLLEKISKMHYGYRTVFTWYMWRSIDPSDVEY